MDIKKIRADFPILKSGVVYLDSAATSLTPEPVVDVMMEYYHEYRANIHRGVHRLSSIASEKYEKSHDEIARFINAKNTELVLTKNLTEGVNLVALSLDFGKGDTVVTTALEHHSNFLPWMRLRKKGVEVEVVKCDKEGSLDLKNLEEKIDKRTKLVAVTHVSNVLGTINPVEKIGKLARENNALFLVDAAQSVPHMRVDVKKLGCDFMVFSGHKMLGPTGTGCLFMREELAGELEPAVLGGGTISEVSTDNYKLAKPPEKWEAGTPNIAGCIGLAEAVRYLKRVGVEKIEGHEKKLTKKIVTELAGIDGLKLYGTKNLENHAGIVSFNVEGMNPHDIASILSDSNIMVRSGHHCAMPLMKTLGCEGLVRTSVYLYNTNEEINKLVDMIDIISKELT